MHTLTPHRARLFAAGLLGAALLALGCVGGTRLLPGSTPTTPQATPPQVMADCWYSGDVLAWIDADGNGARDEGEPPLEGVQVNFSPTFLTGATTGPDGTAHIGGMHPGECSATIAITVMAVAPAGYEPATAKLDYTPERKLYEFGFKPAP
jgi:hypothetical protein